MMLIRQAQENTSKLMPNYLPSGGSTTPIDDNLPNWQELFGTTSTCQCTECRAIDGPAAYFVSLLQFLGNQGMNEDHNTPLDVLIGNANSGHTKYKGKTIPKQIAVPRRPDLAYLKLNCANADTALPYVDIINEILENYVANSKVVDKVMTSEVTSAAAHDTPDDATTAVLDVTPEYMQTANALSAYNKLNAATVVYPYSLPFDRYLETARNYLNFLGITLFQLMQTYGLRDAQGNAVSPLPRAAQLAAESLLISLAEYILITNQDFSGNTPAPHRTLISLPDYFGYVGVPPQDLSWQSDIAQVPVFLTRTALAFGDLVKLLETQYLNPQHLDPSKAVALTISNNPCDVTSMRIENAGSASPPLPLLPPLPAFIRLQRKLGWTISELDYALRAFGEVAPVASATSLPGVNLNIPTIPQPTPISPGFILVAAQIQQLKQSLNLSVSDVVSLWKDVDTDGRASPYVQLFQNKAVVNPPDPAFQLIYSVPLNALPSGKFPPAKWQDGTSQNQASYDLFRRELQFIGSMTDVQRDYLLGVDWAGQDDAAILAVQLLYSQRWYEGIDVAPTAVMRVPGSNPGKPGVSGSHTELVANSIGNHINAILAALRISASDLLAIGQDAGLYEPTPIVAGFLGWAQLSVSNLSALYRYAILARSVGLSVSDLITLKNLTGLNPFGLASGAAGPQTDRMVKFVEASQQVAASPFSVSQLAYLYGLNTASANSLAPLQATQDALMATILTGLQNIAAANAFAPDPAGVALRKKLAVLIPSSQQLDAAMTLIAGTAVYSYTIPSATAIPANLALPPNLNPTVSFALIATVGGTITAGDTVSLTIASGATSVPISWTVLAADTPESIAAALASQINANPSLATAGAAATVVGATISLSAPPAATWSTPQPPNSQTETVTLGVTLNVKGPLSSVNLTSSQHRAAGRWDGIHGRGRSPLRSGA